MWWSRCSSEPMHPNLARRRKMHGGAFSQRECAIRWKANGFLWIYHSGLWKWELRALSDNHFKNWWTNQWHRLPETRQMRIQCPTQFPHCLLEHCWRRAAHLLMCQLTATTAPQKRNFDTKRSNSAILRFNSAIITIINATLLLLSVPKQILKP